jgi:hypothetical protein
MQNDPLPLWQELLAGLRSRLHSPDHAYDVASFPAMQEQGRPIHSREALMTLFAIMKDASEPRLQLAAAKVLLEKGGKTASIPLPQVTEMPTTDEMDAAIALAKAVLDELADIKTAGVGKTGGVDITGAAKPADAAG